MRRGAGRGALIKAGSWGQLSGKTHYGSEREVVKQVREGLPNVCAPVLAQTLVVKPINLRDLPRFVVAAQDGDAVLPPHLEGH